MLSGVNKYFEYGAKFSHHIYPDTNIFFALYFMMTGLHMIHVFVGILLLLWIFVLTRRGAFTAQYNTPVEVVGLYWHLVDLIWIYLFPLLYLIGLNGGKMSQENAKHEEHSHGIKQYIFVWIALMASDRADFMERGKGSGRLFEHSCRHVNRLIQSRDSGSLFHALEI